MGRGSGVGHALRVAAAGLVEFRGQGAGGQGPLELLDGTEHAAAAGDQLVLSDTNDTADQRQHLLAGKVRG